MPSNSSDIYIDFISEYRVYPNNKCEQLVPPYWLEQFSSYERIDRELFSPQISLDSKDIIKRNTVFVKFLEQPMELLKAISQVKNLHIANDMAFIGEYIVYLGHIRFLHTNRMLPFGSWNYKSSREKNKIVFGLDIVSLYAFIHNVSYNESVEIVFRYVTGHAFKANPKRSSKKSFFIQERNPLVHLYCAMDMMDYFFIANKNEKYIQYKNEFGYFICGCKRFLSESGKYEKIFYSVCRHSNSHMIYLLPIAPESPYPVYNCETIKNRRSIYFVEDEVRADYLSEKYREKGFAFVSCPVGVAGLLDINFEMFRSKKMVVNLLNSNVDLEFLWNLKKKCEAYCVDLFFDFGYDMSDMDLDSFYSLLLRKNSWRKKTNSDVPTFGIAESYFFKNEKLYNMFNPKGINLSNIDKEDDGILRGTLPLPGADWERRMILDPIIEEGTITWLFAAEKTGKTWMGLSIAYAVGKGNTIIGKWKTKESFKVLYIDGEMPIDKLNKNIGMIAKGYNECEENGQRPFDIISFFQNGEDYGTILSNDWQEKHKKSLKKYALIVLDNYYSLNENKLDVKPFIRWMKTMTKYNIAFLVLDHTNEKKDLQGSVIKKRASDLGIYLERMEQNEISINIPYSRYLDSKSQDGFKLKAIFTPMSMGYVLKNNDGESDKNYIDQKLKNYACVYVLSEKFKMDHKKIAPLFGVSKSSIDNHVNAFRDDATDSQKQHAPKIRDEDRAFVLEMIDILTCCDNEESLLAMWEAMKYEDVLKYREGKK
ncbi:MAG: AAA family ATPase [Solidesulfovibrio sp.]|uniref:AAA family ATPase n=1 Tax=Solidesulfovibrio sp. TaxID=2910990 RepID=UPI003158AC7E